MSKLPTLTKQKIQKAAMKCYRLNRLLAQHGIAGLYGDFTLRCAVSAAFTMTTMEWLMKATRDKEESAPLSAFVTYPTDLKPWILAVENAHDEWAKKITDEKPLLALLNE